MDTLNLYNEPKILNSSSIDLSKEGEARCEMLDTDSL